MSFGIDTSSNVSRALGCLTNNFVFSDKAYTLSFICRYLVGRYPKKTTVEEVLEINKRGLHVVSAFELDGDNSDSFKQERGLEHAKEAIRAAKALGQPRDSPIYFCVDFDADESNRMKILEYFQAVRLQVRVNDETGYRVGVYGTCDVLDWCKAMNVADAFWQMGSPGLAGGRNATAWSGANIRQFSPQGPACGLTVDLDEAPGGDPGGWMAVTSTEEGTAAPEASEAEP